MTERLSFNKSLVVAVFGITMLCCIQVRAQQSESISFWYFEDSLKNYNFSTIQDVEIKFKHLTESKLLYNITKSAIWIKFKYDELDKSSQSLFLELSAPTIHFLDYFYPNDSYGYSQISTGFLKNYNTRPILSDRFVFPTNSNSSWHYLRLESGHFLNTDLRVVPLSSISADSNTRHLIYGLYAGILLVIVLIVVVLVFQGKQYHFLFYVGFILFGSTITLLESGLYFSSIWPNTPIFNYLFPLYTFGVSFCILNFLRYAFKANELASSLYYFNFWVLTIIPLFPVIYFLITNHYNKAMMIVQASSMLISFLVLLMTLICFFKSKDFKPYYRLISAGQILIVLSIAIYLAAQNQLINLGFLRDFAIMFGGVGEAVCFTMAIFTYQNSIIKKYQGLLRKQNSELQTSVDLRTKELEYKNKDLILAMQEKDSLLNIVVHDLKSPLNQTKALGKLLLHHTTDQNTMIEMLKRIEQASDHGIRLIDELSTISLLEQANDNLELVKIDLSDLMVPLLNNMELIAMQKSIKIDIEIKDNIHKQTYPDYLTRIIENLLSNAIKFSPAGSNISFLINDSCINIRDCGPGFSNEDLKKAFGKFQRLSARPTAGESSTGLGLYIVKLLADKLNLKIQLRSERGQGTTFTLWF